MDKFNEAMKAQKAILENKNYITERIYDVIENATNEGNFLEDDGFSIGMTQDKLTNKKSITILIGEDEYKVSVEFVSQD